MKKIYKIILILLVIMIIPALICIIVLYANDKALLEKFIPWIANPSNLTTFIIGCGLYFPFVNGVWKFIINGITTVITWKMAKRSKIDKIKIYDDDKNNYIYYDDKNNIIDVQFKASSDVSPSQLIEMMSAEIKNRIRDFTEKQK